MPKKLSEIPLKDDSNNPTTIRGWGNVAPSIIERLPSINEALGSSHKLPKLGVVVSIDNPSIHMERKLKFRAILYYRISLRPASAT